MEIVTTVISFLILGLLILSPVLILKALRKRNVKYFFITYLFSGLLITFFLIMLAGWWGDYSNKILLSWYGFNFNEVDFGEGCKNVSEGNLMKVKQLRRNSMGIGWPLKAIIAYVFYWPYLIIVYILSCLFKRLKSKK